MSLTSEVQDAVNLLERLQGSLRANDDPKMGVQCTNDLNTIISVLHNPVFNRIVTIKESLQDLKAQLSNHPSLLPSDFEISTRRGQLLLRTSSEEYPPQRRLSIKTSNENQNAVHQNLLELDTKDGQIVQAPSPDRQWLNGRGPDLVQTDSYDDIDDIESAENLPESEEFQQLIINAAQGREIHHIQLYKPEGTSLGFSVVGLKSEQRGDLGIYLQEIQPTGIAAKDGRLRDGDQILAIDGQLLDSYISHQQAISILQKANKLVDLVVARAPPSVDTEGPQEASEREILEQQKLVEEALGREQRIPYIGKQNIIVPPSIESHTSNMLNTEWAQVEVIHLVNDGSGLGFGIIGGRSTGVVVKTILPGGVADREGRLQSGDHILQIGDVNLRGMGSDQVASVLRQAGSHVRLVVARPVESASPDFQIGRNAPIIETRVLSDPDELDRQLNLLANGFPVSNISITNVRTPLNGGLASSSTSSASTVPAGATNGHGDYLNGDTEVLTVNNQKASTSATVAVLSSDVHHLPSNTSFIPTDHLFHQQEDEEEDDEEGTAVAEGGEGMSLADLPEMENIYLELAKDHQGLGITIAGYVCEREELSGIFVKSINAGSSADRSGQVQVNDQIVEVDNRSLCGLSNHAAVEVLRSTGHVVRLRLARYLRGPKFEQLQQAIANSELKTTPTTPNPPRSELPDLPSSEAIRTALGELEVDVEQLTREDLAEAYNTSVTPLSSGIAQHTSVVTINDAFHQPRNYNVDFHKGSKYQNEARLDDIELLIDTDYLGDLKHSVLSAIVRKWSRIVGPDMEIVVAQLHKFERGGGLGISLEGTVDVEDGREVRPHHYIRSILQDGPVGRDGRLKSGDELLEVNNNKLLGLNHVEVVTILKELPQAVRIVCGRRISGALLDPEDDTLDSPFGSRNGLSGSLQNLVPSCERLVKAKSDGSLASSSAANVSTENTCLAKIKSRSLEPLTGLAMWSSEPQNIELLKGDRGLGFSILDYQDPLNPQDTVIVIRSLVPGGVAEKDGRIIPGDRLVGVNGASLEGASLDEAVGALKGAPKGPVMICVAKPISVLESPGQLDMILGDLGSSDVGSDVMDDVIRDEGEIDENAKNIIEESRRRRKANDSVISTSSSGPPSLPSTEPPCSDKDPMRRKSYGGSSITSDLGRKDSLLMASLSPSLTPFSSTSELAMNFPPGTHHNPYEIVSPVNVHKASVLMVPVATERLIGGSNSSSGTSSAGAHFNKSGGSGRKETDFLQATSQVIYVSSTASKNVVAPSSGEEESSPTKLETFLHPLPKQLQRSIRVRKGTDQLGINIEVVDQGLNGVVVSSLVRGGAVHKDSRIHAGDLIVSVNNESMRNITNSQARAILRRTQLVSTDVSISYIPGQEAAKYRNTVLQSYKPAEGVDQISPRSPYVKGENVEEELGDLTRSATAPSFITRQLRENSQEDLIENSSSGGPILEGRPSSALSDVSGAAATVVTLKNAISEVLGTDERPRSCQRSEDNEEGPFTITFRNVTEAGVVRAESDQNSQHGTNSSSGDYRSVVTTPMMDGKHWGPERTVEVRRDEKGSLGISIVGGKVDLSWSGSSVTGIFVKNVLLNSPAGKSGLLKTGDRILQVENSDLRTATHEKAVEVIKKTGNPVTFVVQSLVQWTPSNSMPPSRDVSRLDSYAPELIQPVRTPTPELIQPGLSDLKNQERQMDATDPDQSSSDTEEESEEEDDRELQGRIQSSRGVEIDRASAGALKKLKNDLQNEDEFGYTTNKVLKKYNAPKGEIQLVDLQKGSNGLGISLAGHKDRTQMSVYVCGLNPNGNAFKDGRIHVGDEILEVNGNVVEGRSHLNASTIFKGIPGPSIKIIVKRKNSGMQDMAVKPITHFPVTLEDESPEEKYSRFKGLTKFVMKKGSRGLGIMIIEGKHAEYGQGIFISDLQEGSIASEAGLMVGDMVLSVNKEEMVGVDYEMAASILKKTEGVINMWVANAARAVSSTPDVISKTVEPKKPEIPPKPSVLLKPPIPAKPPTINKPSTISMTSKPSSIHESVPPRTSSGTLQHSDNILHSTEDPPVDPSLVDIKPGRETTIEIVKEKMGLGLSIVGGSDTLLGAIIIHEVYPDGAAAKDGRLKPGDQILEVNSENFRVITHQKALSVLRQTPSKVKMVVYREEGTQKEEDLYDVIKVQLTKKSGKGLGLSIVGRKNGPGVFISDLVPGGVAESDGRLMQGDQILDVNEKELKTATQEQAAAILKCAPASVSMKIGRLKPGKKVTPTPTTTWPITVSEGPPPRASSSLTPEFAFPHPPLLLSSQIIPQPPQDMPPSPLRTVVLDRGDDGLGFSIVGGFGSNLGDLPIYVKSVFERGAAAREGTLRRGDQILQVNGLSLAALTHAQAVSILKDAKGTVALVILPSK